MAFEQPDPSDEAGEQRFAGGALKKFAPMAALGAGLLLLIFLLSLAF